MSTLHDAIRKGVEPKALTKLLKKKNVSVNHQDDSLQTPLHIAAIDDQLELGRCLLKAGANPNLRDTSGWTPLHCACKNGHLRFCELLCQTKNIDPSILTIEKTSPLYYLVRKPPSREESDLYSFILIRLTQSIDLKQRNAHGESTIHSACMGSNKQAIQYALDHGVSANEPTAHGETPLHYATRVGNMIIIKFLLAKGGNPYIESVSGESPLDIAKEYKMAEVIDQFELIQPPQEKTRGSPTMQTTTFTELAARPVRMNRSKSEILKGFCYRLNSPLAHNAREVTEEKEKGKKGKVKLKGGFGKRISNLIIGGGSKNESDVPLPSPSSQSPRHFSAGMKLSEIPDSEIGKVGNFPTWRNVRDGFLSLVTLVITKVAKNLIIFDNGVALYVLSQGVYFVKSVNYPVNDRDFVFDVLFYENGEKMFIRFACTSARSLLEWISLLGPQIPTPVLPVPNKPYAIPPDAEEVVPIYFSKNSIDLAGGLDKDQEVLVQYLYDLMYVEDPSAAEDRSYFQRTLFFDEKLNQPKKETISMILRVFSLAGDPIEALWKCSHFLVFLFSSPHAISGLLLWVVDGKLRVTEKRIENSPYPSLPPPSSSSSSSSSSAPSPPSSSSFSCPSIDETIQEWDFGVMIFHRYILENKECVEFLKHVMEPPLQRIYSFTEPASQSLDATTSPGKMALATSAPLIVTNSTATPTKSRRYSRISSSETLNSPSQNGANSPPQNCRNPSQCILNILPVCQDLIQRLFSKVNETPVPLRQFFRYAKEQTTTKFPKGELKRFMLIFLFRHLLCPIILNPKGFGIQVEPVDDRSQDHVLLMAKLIHSMTTDTSVVTTDSFMSSQVTLFVKNTLLKMENYFDELTDLASIEEALKGTAVRFAVVSLERESVETFFDFLRDSLPLELLPFLTEEEKKKRGKGGEEEEEEDGVPAFASPSPERLSKLLSHNQTKLMKRLSVKQMRRPSSFILTEPSDIQNLGEGEDLGWNGDAQPAKKLVRSSSGKRIRSKSISPPPLRKQFSIPSPSRLEATNSGEEKGEGKAYKFFFATKIKPLRDIWPSRRPAPLKWPKETHHPFDWLSLTEETKQNFVCEWGSSETIISNESEFDIEHVERITTRFFRDHMMQEAHCNYICLDEMHGPVACSVEDPTKASGDQVKVIVRFAAEDHRMFGVNPSASKRPRSFSGSVPSKIIKRDPTLRILCSCLPQLESMRLVQVRNDESKLDEKLVKFEEENSIVKTFKFGVLSMRKGQYTEDEWYSNGVSPDLSHFLDLMGTKIALKDWRSFRGGLDTRGETTGKHSYYTEHRGFEIMFHVAGLLPFSAEDHQQLERKRHLGNDVVLVLFLEQDVDELDVTIIKSHFNHVFCVVSKNVEKSRDMGTDQYNVMTVNKKEVFPYPPFLPKGWTIPHTPQGREFLLTKLINGQQAALTAPVFLKKAERTRRAVLSDIVETTLAEVRK